MTYPVQFRHVAGQTIVDFVRVRHRVFRLPVLLLVVLLTLSGCGGTGTSTTEPIAWHLDPTATHIPPPTATLPPVPTATTQPSPTATSVPEQHGDSHGASTLSADELQTLQPNELGVVTVFEYHVITTNPEEEAQFVRTKDDFIADLTWMYEHDFYAVPLRDVLENRISAPAGKIPMVLTFDDATTWQFDATEDADGNLVISPDSAVGILEDFFAAHPDFGHTAVFAVVVNNCFAFPDADQMPLCEKKLKWLADHGYEIANHTMNHADLLDVTDDEFMHEVGETKLFIDEHVSGPANLGDVLFLPFGNYPDKDDHQDQRAMMRDGFEYKGETIKLAGAMMVGSNPAVSPASVSWDPIWIPRVQCFDESLEYWFDVFTSGGTVLYVSDGDPNTITVPDPLPGWLPGELDPDLIQEWGRDLVQYDPDTGEVNGSGRTNGRKHDDARGDLG